MLGRAKPTAINVVLEKKKTDLQCRLIISAPGGFTIGQSTPISDVRIFCFLALHFLHSRESEANDKTRASESARRILRNYRRQDRSICRQTPRRPQSQLQGAGDPRQNGS
jgi:hypothetical protein